VVPASPSMNTLGMRYPKKEKGQGALPPGPKLGPEAPDPRELGCV
jgi:hypothetical protein